MLNTTPETVVKVDCDICSKLIRDLALVQAEKFPGTSPQYPGSQLLEGDCPHAQTFRKLVFKNQKTGTRALEPSANVTITTWNRTLKFHFRVGQEFTDSYETDWIAWMGARDDSVHPGIGRKVDEHWIDLNLVQNWIHSCNETHTHCNDLLHADEDVVCPMFLVDVLDCCIVEGASVKENYIALSYTWGQVDSITHIKSLTSQLCKPGVLKEGSLASRIPQTIKDAIALAGSLHQRYLWVDSLCVVQDAQEVLVHELTRMHLIYRSASFTIVAAGGRDAGFGLRGLKGLTAPREFDTKEFQLGGSQWVRPVKSFFDFSRQDYAQSENNYFMRAWTFQEFCFSRRRLLFMNNTVIWQCQTHEIYEELSVNYPTDKIYSLWNPTTGTEAKQEPGLSYINRFINHYNRRALTNPFDALPAFLGIQAHLGLTFGNGLIYGHPELLFDISLLWDHTNPVNRKTASKSPKSVATPYKLPSWSWLGWNGPVHLPEDVEFVSSKGFIHGFTESVSQWYTEPSPVSPKRRQVLINWQNHRAKALEDPEYNLEGWNRVKVDGKYARFSATTTPTPKSDYQHPRFSERTRYPIPVPFSKMKYNSPPQHEFLFAQTSQAVFSLKYSPPERLKVGNSFDTSLLLASKAKKIAGYILLPSPKELELFTTREKSSDIKLVAICKGWTTKIHSVASSYGYRPQDETFREGDNQPSEGDIRLFSRSRPIRASCYHVLWVEWKDGIAYRKGVGAIKTAIWEENTQGCEKIDLILG